MRRRFQAIFCCVLPIWFVSCASIPKIEKKRLLAELEKPENAELSEYYKQNYWRKYQITEHTDFDFSGEDIHAMFAASRRCRVYYQKITEKLVDEQGNLKRILNKYSADQLRGLRDKLTANVRTVCSSLKKETGLVKEGASVFFYKYIQPEIFANEKRGITALDELIALKAREEEAQRKIKEAGG